MVFADAFDMVYTINYDFQYFLQKANNLHLRIEILSLFDSLTRNQITTEQKRNDGLENVEKCLSL